MQNWSYLFPYIKSFISIPFILRINSKASGDKTLHYPASPCLPFQPRLSFSASTISASTLTFKQPQSAYHATHLLLRGLMLSLSLEKLVHSDWTIPDHSLHWDGALLCSPIYLVHIFITVLPYCFVISIVPDTEWVISGTYFLFFSHLCLVVGTVTWH